MIHRAVRPCGLLLAALAVAGPVFAVDGYTVRRVQGSLKDADTRFARVAAPDTVLRSAAADTTLQSRPAASSFGTVQAPPTTFRIFREAEVPKDRLQVTREVLVALQARETPQQAIVVDLPADVLFDFDKATLRPDAADALAKAAELLRSYPGAPVRINGHTDAKGTDDYNDALSFKRAQTVAAALQQGQGRSFPTEGFGKRRPVAPNTTVDGRDDPAGRQRNRRVEIVIEPMAAAAGTAR
ncbi:OmpA family protein [Xylophilus sp. Leaf220]|uniref:OmpA family protein n=1 Tax=Xylophilus sp. Leaf220 TaxID=1735686 RepID=UPI0006FDA9B5|nr:OmpA family protein [Xylophilus sp. Leaf220]KQM68456.1 hypothetical protein ASE76_14275 [Xylophilus sp. Leaf220]